MQIGKQRKKIHLKIKTYVYFENIYKSKWRLFRLIFKKITTCWEITNINGILFFIYSYLFFCHLFVFRTTQSLPAEDTGIIHFSNEIFLHVMCRFILLQLLQRIKIWIRTLHAVVTEIVLWNSIIINIYTRHIWTVCQLRWVV